MNLLGGSFRVGRVFGINVRVHVLFLVFVAFELWRARADWHAELVFLGMLFGVVLLHEFGHCFGARSVGGYAEDILMWPLGGLAFAQAPMRPWPQFVTVACGPLVNVVLGLVSGAIVAAYTLSLDPVLLNPFGGMYVPQGTSWVETLWIFYQVNLFLLAFNLLPIYPMDGGQLFHAILWPFLGLQRATVIACQVGLVGAGIFALLGLRSGGGGMLLFIAIFGGMTCWQRLQAAKHGFLVEDPVYRRYDSGARSRGSFWSRLFKSRSRQRTPVAPGAPARVVNPNPGAWEAHQEELAREEAELDRILKKVKERGIQSLSYVERQTLERITRKRREKEEQLQRGNRV